MKEASFLGVDVGTQGVRVLWVTEKGHVLGKADVKTAPEENYRREQSPEKWWESCLACLQAVLAPRRFTPEIGSIRGISVTSTSGTVIPLDGYDRPLHDAIMYSDTRQAAEGKRCSDAARQFHPDGYTAFNTSCGLPKMLWYVGEFPEKAANIRTWIHAADFITGRLCGNFRVTDYTNVLKSGYDLRAGKWPDYICEQLPVRKEWLQEVVPSGTPVGMLTRELRELLHLPEIKVVAGMTDGCASQVASGAVNPGDWNTTLGTTLVIKGVTKVKVDDPEGRLYCHRHPQGYWMPGGASNTGGDWISGDFGEDLDAMERAASQLMPSGLLTYPLLQEGERFPFVSREARGFWDPGIKCREERFTSGLEGVAYIERLAFTLAEALSGERVNAVYTAGGGGGSVVWSEIRAAVLGRPVYRMAAASGALGAAILAAAGVHFGSLSEAAGMMTQIAGVAEPDNALKAAYDDSFGKFVAKLEQKGYLTRPFTI